MQHNSCNSLQVTDMKLSCNVAEFDSICSVWHFTVDGKLCDWYLVV